MFEMPTSYVSMLAGLTTSELYTVLESLHGLRSTRNPAVAPFERLAMAELACRRDIRFSRQLMESRYARLNAWRTDPCCGDCCALFRALWSKVSESRTHEGYRDWLGSLPDQDSVSRAYLGRANPAAWSSEKALRMGISSHG